MAADVGGESWQEAIAALARAQIRTEEQFGVLAAAQARTDEHLATLTMRVDALTERVDRLTGRVDALTERVDRLTERVEAFAAAQVRTEERLVALIDVVGVLSHKVDMLQDDVGTLKGWAWESRYRERAPAYLGRLVRGIQVLSAQQLAALVEKAVSDGQLSESEADDVRLADLVCRGKSKEGGAATYLLLEVSAGVGLSDVARAARRAGLLARTGTPVLPVVGGQRIIPEAQREAAALGVWQVRDGMVTSPTDAPERL